MKTITYDETQWKLVPIEPTYDMADAVRHFALPAVMIDSFAAPEPPAQPSKPIGLVESSTLGNRKQAPSATTTPIAPPPAPRTAQPAPKNAFVKLCIYERRHGTFATLGSRVLFGAVTSPTGQPTRTYKIPLDDLREIIDHAVRTGEQE